MNWCKFGFHSWYETNRMYEEHRNFSKYIKSRGFTEYSVGRFTYWCLETPYGNIELNDIDQISYHTWDFKVKYCKKCGKLIYNFSLEDHIKEFENKIARITEKLKLEREIDTKLKEKL